MEVSDARKLHALEDENRRLKHIVADQALPRRSSTPRSAGRESCGRSTSSPRLIPLPKAIVSDNGTEFTSGAFLSWAEKHGIALRFIQPGKPNQNAFVESFNGKLRLECLNAHWFSTLDDARQTIETWRLDYNDVRPHSSLDEKTPTDFAAAHRETAA
jgi:putative transposase